MADVIPDLDTPSLEETIARQQLRDSLHDLMAACLRPREQEALCLRFGLNGDSQTLEKVAQKYGVTREQVRQIEVRALRRLRRASARAEQAQKGLGLGIEIGSRVRLRGEYQMSNEHQTVICQRCGRGFVLLPTYLRFLARRGVEVEVPMQCMSCFLKAGPLPKQCGKVKWFSQRRRYGFIQRDDELPDAFVHVNDFRNAAEALWVRDGDIVEFKVEQAPKGPRAMDVVVLKTA